MMTFQKTVALFLCLSLLCPFSVAAGPAGGTSSSPESSRPSTGTDPYGGLLPETGSSDFARDLAPSPGARSNARGSGLLTGDEASGARGSEYVSGYFRGAVLMPISIWGSVRQTGVHHIPSQSNLLNLMTYAGGPNPDADLGKVTIKRSRNEKPEVLNVDVESLLQNPAGTPPLLQPNDIVLVPMARPIIHNNTVLVVGLVSSLLGIVVSSILISQQLK